jgi:cytochrome d ubiquinol oxidase subunit II
VGITALALFIMHGTIYMVLKTEGEFQAKLRSWVNRTILAFMICYALTTLATLFLVPAMLDNLWAEPVMFIFPVLSLLVILNIPREIHHGRNFLAFLSSCLAVAGLLATFGVGVYPNLIVSSPDVMNSLTIYNAASSEKTHGIMLIIAALGMPIVIAYTTSIYWIFRGKVKLDASSY